MDNQFKLMKYSSFLSRLVSFMLIGGILLVVAPTNSFAFNDIQQTKTQDSSGCDPSSTCRNSGQNHASVLGGGDNNVIRQNLDQINRCNANSQCSNIPNEDFLVVGNSAELNGDGNSVNQRIQSSNNCRHSTCENRADIGSETGIAPEIEGSQNIIDQQVIQNNDCSDSRCQNSFDQFFGAVSDNNQLTMKGGQSNTCAINSDCDNNVGFAIFLLNDEHRNLENSQSNNCIRESTCSNVGFRGSQSNYCFNGSSCTTEGFGNTQTTCANGATCENIGENTNVISNSANCNSGADNTTTFCQPGRTLTLHNH